MWPLSSIALLKAVVLTACGRPDLSCNSASQTDRGHHKKPLSRHAARNNHAQCQSCPLSVCTPLRITPLTSLLDLCRLKSSLSVTSAPASPQRLPGETSDETRSGAAAITFENAPTCLRSITGMHERPDILSMCSWVVLAVASAVPPTVLSLTPLVCRDFVPAGTVSGTNKQLAIPDDRKNVLSFQWTVVAQFAWRYCCCTC